MRSLKLFTSIIVFLVAGALLCFGTAAASPSKTLTVGNGSGYWGDTVSLPITVDDAAGIGGAAFTLFYDSAVFTFLGLDADTKAISNGDEYKVPDTDPPRYVVSDTQKETVSNTLFFQCNNEQLKGRVMVAGASAKALTQPGLFNAKFQIKEGVAEGTYKIGLDRTIVHNPAAGYNAPTFIPALVGMPAADVNAQGFYEIPVFPATLVNGSVKVTPPAASLFSIGGSVTYGVAGGDPANGASVVLKKAENGRYLPKAQTTVQDGTFNFANNTAGDYRVCVASNDPRYYSNEADVPNVAADVNDADVILPAPVRTSGILTINGGHLSGLKVKVMNGDQVVGIYPVNADGTYQSGPLPPGGDYKAYAVYGSLASDELTGSYNWAVTLRSIAGTVNGLEIGTVATVTAVSEKGRIMRPVATDAGGAFIIENLVPADDYLLAAVATGLPVLYYDGQTDITEATRVDISSTDADTINFDYSSVTKGTLSGTVTDGANPAGGVGVFAFSVDTFALVSVETANDGSYELTLAPGTYELFVIKGNGAVFYYDADSDNHVSQNETTADLLPVTTGGALTGKDMNIAECDKALTGKVTYERTDGNPVPFALIQAFSGDKRAVDITGPDGTYTLTGLCDGLIYTVEMDPQVGDYGIQARTVTAGTDTTLDFVIDTGHVLSGVVAEADNSGTTIPNAAIYLRDQETHTLVGDRMHFSNSQGDYAIRDIPTGIYTLMASHPEYRHFTLANLAINADTPLDIPMVKGAHFYGTVSDDNGALAGALVIVTRSGETPVYAVTDAQGAYSIYGLDNTKNDYVILAQKQGYLRSVQTGKQPATGTGNQADFHLARPAALFNLSGMITSGCTDPASPLENALVVISSASKKFFSSTRSDAGGTYSFRNLPQSDDYRFVVVPGAGLQVIVETDLSFAGDATRNVEISCGSEISGTITWSGTGKGYVLLYTDANAFVDFTVVDTSGGTYAFSGLAGGNYKVLAFAPGNTPAWYNGKSGIASADPVAAGATGISIDLTD